MEYVFSTRSQRIQYAFSTYSVRIQYVFTSRGEREIGVTGLPVPGDGEKLSELRFVGLKDWRIE